MRILFVRHGQTHHNVNNISQGQFDSKLTKEGHKQAGLLAQRLKSESIDFAYTSDLSRAYETCRAIMSFHPRVNILEDVNLREQSKGVFENKSALYWKIDFKQKNVHYVYWHPKDGESLDIASKRMLIFWNNILNNHSSGTILVVSHGGVLSTLFAHLDNKNILNYRTFAPKNTAITIVEVENKNPRIKLLNCSAHLANLENLS